MFKVYWYRSGNSWELTIGWGWIALIVGVLYLHFFH